MNEEQTNNTMPPEEAPVEKTFTQDQVSAIAAKESRQAVASLLRDAGIAADEDPKKALKAFKAWRDQQKSDLQKATEAQSALEQARDAAEKKAEDLERRFLALQLGVPADKADRYVKLAGAYMTEDKDFAKALQEAVKDFPVPDKGVAGAGANPPGADTKPNKTRPKGTVIF